MKTDLFLLTTLITTLTIAHPYTRITDYHQYLNQWKAQVPAHLTHDVTHLAKHQQTCGSDKCPFFYFEYKNENVNQSIRNRTVLIVSGMHGNQYLGPMALLYGYKYFKAGHIVYFPVANPSGFAKSIRNTFPSNRDPNRDFPVDRNIDCYNTNAALIVDHLFRTYSFDLSLMLHQGATEIGFNWGTETHVANSHTEDYDIQLSIAQMMSRVGGENKGLGMKEFRIGTMNEAIYPATGTLDDWAYAVGKYPEIITKCAGYQYEAYPKGMANGLVFLIEMGPHNTKLLGSQEAVHVKIGQEHGQDGYISRGIRVVKATLDVVDPSLEISWNNTQAKIYVRGCPSAVVNSFSAVAYPNTLQQSSPIELINSTFTLVLQGDVGPDLPRPTLVRYSNNVTNIEGYSIKVTGQMECSSEWVGKGTTFFSQLRKYQLNYTTVASQRLEFAVAGSDGVVGWVEEWISQYSWLEISIFGIVVLVVLIIMSAIFAVLQCLLKPAENKRTEKFQANETNQELDEEDLHTARGGIIEENM